jgi:hypothetical protein
VRVEVQMEGTEFTMALRSSGNRRTSVEVLGWRALVLDELQGVGGKGMGSSKRAPRDLDHYLGSSEKPLCSIRL